MERKKIVLNKAQKKTRKYSAATGKKRQMERNTHKFEQLIYHVKKIEEMKSQKFEFAFVQKTRVLCFEKNVFG